MTTVSASLSQETDASTLRPRLKDSIRLSESLIRQAEEIMENERRMPDEIIDAFYEIGMFRAFMPKSVGGLEAHPWEWLEGVEEASRINGSVGWLCMLHTGATWTSEETLSKVLETSRWITAGNLGRAAGKAVKVEGGYRISGRWPFCSGSPEATYLFGRSVLHDENGPVTHPVDGLPWYVTAYFPAHQATLIDTWDGLGLRGTGSGDIEVEDIFVPDEMVNEMGIWELNTDLPQYRANFNLAAHGAHAIGLARAAVDEFIGMAHQAARRGSHRQRRMGNEQVHQIAVGKALTLIDAARNYLRSAVEEAWEAAQHSFHIDYELRVKMHQANLLALSLCRQATDLVYQQAGSAGVFKGRPIERIYRDIVVASQHIIVQDSSYDRVGQYFLTREMPEGPTIDLEGGFIRGPHNEASALT